MASVSQTGWPYVQHRGGPPGFLWVIDETTLAFADFQGNRQYISVGNLSGDWRVALILVDYAGRRRMKLYARAEIVALADDPALAQAVLVPGYRARPERAMQLHLEAFDWNCLQHITPRFTEAELATVMQRIADLEDENSKLRARLATQGE